MKNINLVKNFSTGLKNMACDSLVGIPKGCDNNIGGIYTAYIFDMDDFDATGSTFSTSTYSWTTFQLTLGAEAANFTFKRNTSEYTSEAQVDLVAGSSFYKNTVTLMFHKREADKSKAIKILGEGQRYLGVVIGDAMGNFWYFENMQLTADTGGSGKAKADGSNYNITLVGEQEFPVGTVSAADAEALLSPAS